MHRLVFSSLVLASAACASTPDTSTPDTNRTTSAIGASEPAAGIAGSWGFDLAASADVASAVREECATESKGDEKAAKACFDAAAQHAAGEKLKFTELDAGKTTWTSFAKKADGSSEVFVVAPLAVEANAPGHFTARLAGKATGPQAGAISSGPASIQIETPDAHTLVMVDPKKGRLLFTRE